MASFAAALSAGLRGRMSLGVGLGSGVVSGTCGRSEEVMVCSSAEWSSVSPMG